MIAVDVKVKRDGIDYRIDLEVHTQPVEKATQDILTLEYVVQAYEHDKRNQIVIRASSTQDHGKRIECPESYIPGCLVLFGWVDSIENTPQNHAHNKIANAENNFTANWMNQVVYEDNVGG